MPCLLIYAISVFLQILCVCGFSCVYSYFLFMKMRIKYSIPLKTISVNPTDSVEMLQKQRLLPQHFDNLSYLKNIRNEMKQAKRYATKYHFDFSPHALFIPSKMETTSVAKFLQFFQITVKHINHLRHLTSAFHLIFSA